MLWYVMRWLNVVNKKVYYGVTKVNSPFDNPTASIPTNEELRADIVVHGIRNIVPVALSLRDTAEEAQKEIDQLIALQKSVAPNLLYNKSHDDSGEMKKGIVYHDTKSGVMSLLKKKKWITNGRQDVSVGPQWIIARTGDPDVAPDGWWFGKTWNFKRRTLWNQEVDPPVALRTVDTAKEPKYINNGEYDEEMEWSPLPGARKLETGDNIENLGDD